MVRVAGGYYFIALNSPLVTAVIPSLKDDEIHRIRGVKDIY